MSATDKSNGKDCAFPALRENDNQDMPLIAASFGLTKRELFAMAAMQGLWSGPGMVTSFEDVASAAVGQADALLAELAK